jgi:hypothetical protein
MGTSNVVWWCITFLSALLYDCAFLIPEVCGVAVIPAVILFVLLLDERKVFFKALCWGIIVFSVQLWWLLLLLQNFAACGPCVSAVLYCAITLYFAGTVGCFAVIAQCLVRSFACRWQRLTCLTILLSLYFYLLEQAGAWFVGYQEGYPFISPLIPLADSRWFIALVCIASSWFNGPNYFGVKLPERYQIVFCSPVVSKHAGRHDAYLQTPSAVGQAIFHRLWRLGLNEKTNDQEVVIVVSPESSFPFALNHYPQLPVFWSQALPSKVNFLLGGHSSISKKLFQTIFWTQNGLIKKNYVKTHRVPFIERIPRFWKKMPCARNIFKHDLTAFSRFSHHNLCDCVFQIDHELAIIPQICSEFFFGTNLQKMVNLKSMSAYVVIFFFVNDSWFSPVFQKIMQLRARLQAAWVGLPLVYVGHQESFFVL